MYQIDFHKPLHIHFIGIGGISMSGLAEILSARILSFPVPIPNPVLLPRHWRKKEPPSITDSVPQTLPMT